MPARFPSEGSADMSEFDYIDRVVLCGANAYDKKYYFNPEFSALPESVQNDIHIICVLFTEEVGGMFRMEFNEEGELELVTEAAEEDILYDEIGAGLLVKEVQKSRQELFEELSLFYRVVYLGEDLE